MINSDIKNIIIKKLHHNAYRCIDSEATRKFYEDFLKLPLLKSLEIDVTKTGRKSKILHTFYSMRDNSYLAFFEVPDSPFTFKKQHDFDLHIALEVEKKDLYMFCNLIVFYFLKNPLHYLLFVLVVEFYLFVFLNHHGKMV